MGRPVRLRESAAFLKETCREMLRTANAWVPGMFEGDIPLWHDAVGGVRAFTEVVVGNGEKVLPLGMFVVTKK